MKAALSIVHIFVNGRIASWHDNDLVQQCVPFYRKVGIVCTTFISIFGNVTLARNFAFPGNIVRCFCVNTCNILIGWNCQNVGLWNLKEKYVVFV